MANDKLIDMMKLVKDGLMASNKATLSNAQKAAITLAGLSDGALEKIFVNRETDSYIEFRMPTLANLVANHYIDLFGLESIREMVKKTSVSRHEITYSHVLGMKEISIKNIAIIYNELKSVPNAIDYYNGTIPGNVGFYYTNVCFDIAARCIGIKFNARVTPHVLFIDKINFYSGDGLTIEKLLVNTSVDVNDRTLALALLPFYTVWNRVTQRNVKFTVKQYTKLIGNYIQDTDCVTDRLVFTKIFSYLNDNQAYMDSDIYPFSFQDLRWTYSSLFTSSDELMSRINVSLNSGNLKELSKHHVAHIETSTNVKAKAPIAMSFMLGLVDWFFRLRYRWNHEYAVGKAATIHYSQIFGKVKYKQERSFNYKNNRILLESIGHTFIGYETFSIDSKLSLLKGQCKVLLAAFGEDSYTDSSDGESLISVADMSKLMDCQYSNEREFIAANSFVKTLELMVPTQHFTLFHLASAHIYYSKYILKDYGLEYLNIEHNLSMEDIKFWVES